MEKIKVLVTGCNGHMGQIVCRLIEESEDMEVLCGLDTATPVASEFPVFNNIKELEEADVIPDVIIDFSAAACTEDVLCNFAYINRIPTVIATTGFNNNQLHRIERCSEGTIVCLSSNMSYLVNLLAEMLSEYAPKLLDYDIEIHEIHHNRKKDAPSGTAKMLAEVINSSLDNKMEIVYDGRKGERGANEIGVSSTRLGNVVGKHTIYFGGQYDTLTITHEASSRDMFAEGAIKAAKCMLKLQEEGVTNGLFSMKDVH